MANYSVGDCAASVSSGSEPDSVESHCGSDQKFVLLLHCIVWITS